MIVEVVLVKGRHAEGVDPEQFVGQPVMAEPGSSHETGKVTAAWVVGDEIRASIEVNDPVFVDIFTRDGLGEVRFR